MKGKDLLYSQILEEGGTWEEQPGSRLNQAGRELRVNTREQVPLLGSGTIPTQVKGMRGFYWCI